MKKDITNLSLGGRLLSTCQLIAQMQTALAQTKAYNTEVLKKLSVLANVEGFNVSLSAPMTAEVALSVTWSCENRREGISPSEDKEILMMVDNIESNGFKRVDVQHDSHKIIATFRVR